MFPRLPSKVKDEVPRARKTYSIHSLKSIDSLIRYFGNSFLDSQCISSDHINRQTLRTVIFHDFYYSSCDVLVFCRLDALVKSP